MCKSLVVLNSKNVFPKERDTSIVSLCPQCREVYIKYRNVDGKHVLLSTVPLDSMLAFLISRSPKRNVSVPHLGFYFPEEYMLKKLLYEKKPSMHPKKLLSAVEQEDSETLLSIVRTAETIDEIRNIGNKYRKVSKSGNWPLVANIVYGDACDRGDKDVVARLYLHLF